MTLNEIVQAVISKTMRVDKEAEIRSAVRKAIRTVHGAGYFPMDVVEDQIALNGTFTKFKVPLPPRVRKFINVAPLGSSGLPIRISTKDNTFEYVQPSDLIDSHYQRRSDMYYVTGATLMVNSSVGVANLYVSYYEIPEVADNDLETWLMRDHESVIIEATLATFYRSVGKMSHADASKRAMYEELQMLINDYTCMAE